MALLRFEKELSGGPVWIESECVEALYAREHSLTVVELVLPDVTFAVKGDPAAIAARINAFNMDTEVTVTDTDDTKAREQRVSDPADVLRAMHRAPRLLWEERFDGPYVPEDYRVTTVRFHDNLYETMVTGEGRYDGLTWTAYDAREALSLFEAIANKLRRQGDPRDISGWTPQ